MPSPVAAVLPYHRIAAGECRRDVGERLVAEIELNPERATDHGARRGELDRHYVFFVALPVALVLVDDDEISVGECGDRRLALKSGEPVRRQQRVDAVDLQLPTDKCDVPCHSSPLPHSARRLAAPH